MNETLTNQFSASLNPDTPIQPLLNAREYWLGDTNPGLKTRIGNIDQADMQRLDNLFATNQELHARVLHRYLELCGALRDECLKLGIAADQVILSDSDRAELLLMAERIQIRGSALANKAKEQAQQLASNDAPTAGLLIDRIIKQYMQSEQAIITHLAHKMKVRLAEQAAQQTTQAEDPRQGEWQQWGEAWEVADHAQRQQLLAQSGGDLKVELQDRTARLLGKFFDADVNYAALRQPLQ